MLEYASNVAREYDIYQQIRSSLRLHLHAEKACRVFFGNVSTNFLSVLKKPLQVKAFAFRIPFGFWKVQSVDYPHSRVSAFVLTL